MNQPPPPSTFPPDLADAAGSAARGEVVSLHARLPMDWVETITPESALVDGMADILTLLRALLMLDEPAPATDASRSDATSHLERRLDLLLLMASTALRGMQQLPRERTCVLSARRLYWASDESVGVGRRIWVRVWLRHRIALPLMLPGQVVEEEVEGEQLWHRLDIEPLEPALQNDLERFVFRHHRRQVARQRSGL
jgi:hypothetical protein